MGFGYKLCFLLFQDVDDLPFRKGEILCVLNKDEDQWWTARNTQGQVGQIPVPYVQKVTLKFLYFLCILCVLVLIWSVLSTYLPNQLSLFCIFESGCQCRILFFLLLYEIPYASLLFELG